MKKSDLLKNLAQVEETRRALLGEIAQMTSGEKIEALAAAQPKIEPETPEAEALLESGYQMNVEAAERIIAERDKNPQAWPLEEYRNAKAMLAAYHAKSREPTSTREGWHRTQPR